MSGTARRFPLAWDSRYRVAARPFGIDPHRAWVEVSDRELDARFGRWRLRTPLQNVASVQLTGPYALIKTAGPPRLGITDRGLTFAGNGRRGVLISFRSPVRVIGPLRHPELTVTVADPDGLKMELSRRLGAQAGTDTRE